MDIHLSSRTLPQLFFYLGRYQTLHKVVLDKVQGRLLHGVKNMEIGRILGL